MMSPTPSVPEGSLVLITGVNGHLASEIAHQFLTRGYRVRGTVRDPAKSSWLVNDVFKTHTATGAFSLIQVPQIDAPGAFDTAVKDVSIIQHTATFGFGIDPNEIIPREVAAVRNLLTAASKEPSVKEFVLTSSVVAATMFTPTNREHITQDSWNEKAVELAWAPPPYDESRAFAVYSAGKVASEREIWRFRKEEKPVFGINTVLPQSIMGKRLNKNCTSLSAALLPDLYEGRTTIHETIVPALSAVDVRDVALLHVAAALDPEIDGQRLQAWGTPMTWNEVLKIMRRLFPTHEFIKDWEQEASYNLTADLELELRLLEKWGGQGGWRPVEETIKDNMDHIPRD